MAKATTSKARLSIPKTAIKKALAAEKREKSAAGVRSKATDTFQNFALNLGMGTNNAMSSGSYGFTPITRNRALLEWIYRGSWLGGVAVDSVADDMTRAKIDIHSKLEPGALEKISSATVRMGTWTGINEALKWARLYGGAILYFMVDGQDPSTPLRLETVGRGQFKGVMPFDRWMLDPSLNNLVTEQGKSLGKPKYYKTIIQPGVPQLNIHYTRCIRLEGVKLPFNQRMMEGLWGMSVIERLYDRLVAFDSATAGGAQLAYKAFLRTVKVKDLRNLAAMGGKGFAAVQAMFNLMSMFQSVEGITLLDAEDEMVTQTTGGATSEIVGIIDKLGEQISGALQIPIVRLFGQSPGGLNASGDSDFRTYYDGVNEEQEKELREGVHAIYVMTAQSEGVPFAEDFNFKFRSLWQMTDDQQATMSNTDTTSVTNVFGTGLISAKTALQELRQRGATANRWSNITDEMIEEADDQPPPQPGQGDPNMLGGEMGGEMPGMEGEEDPGDEGPEFAGDPSAEADALLSRLKASDHAARDINNFQESQHARGKGEKGGQFVKKGEGGGGKSGNIATRSGKAVVGYGKRKVDTAVRTAKAIRHLMTKEGAKEAIHATIEKLKEPEVQKELFAGAVQFTLYHLVKLDYGPDLEAAITHEVKHLSDHAKIAKGKVKSALANIVGDLIKKRGSDGSTKDAEGDEVSQQLLMLLKAIVETSIDEDDEGFDDEEGDDDDDGEREGGEPNGDDPSAHRKKAEDFLPSTEPSAEDSPNNDDQGKTPKVANYLQAALGRQAGISAKTGDSIWKLPSRDVGGLSIHVECPMGERRWANGPRLPADYGYIRHTGSAEVADPGQDPAIHTDAMDVLVHERADGTQPVHVIDQHKADGSFEEHKVMLGYEGVDEALSAYAEAYHGAPVHAGGMTILSHGELEAWLRQGDLTKPLGAPPNN